MRLRLEPTPLRRVGLDREELAWAGGLFEGEGCVYVKTGNKEAHSKSVRVSMQMTDLDPLERFQRAVGFGSVTGPYTPLSSRSKPVYAWSASGFQLSQALVAMLWPWLGLRRRETARQKLLEGRGMSRSQAALAFFAEKRGVA